MRQRENNTSSSQERDQDTKEMGLEREWRKNIQVTHVKKRNI
jgi:hypothetical protein